MRMLNRKLRWMLAMVLALLLTIPTAALAGEDDRAAMQAYWRIVGEGAGATPLARAMSGEAVALTELTAITADDLMTFAAEYRLPIDMARYAWYATMAEVLRSQPPESLALFLSMPETARDAQLNADRRANRRSLTEAEVRRIAEETGLPGGFVAWLMLEDEWHEGDWEDASDWREGRSGWLFADHAYEKELREAYGKSAVVDDDEVERVLRQNGLRYDD